jgi:hypothetical protein
LKEELKKIDFYTVSIGTAQQICNKLDHELGKVVDLLTPIVSKTVRNDKFEPSFITAGKRSYQPAQKSKKEKMSLFNEEMQKLLREKLRQLCTTSKNQKLSKFGTKQLVESS